MGGNRAGGKLVDEWERVMISIILRRLRSDENGTFGELLMGDERLCVTCEDPWKNNQRQVSCIPAGTYECTPYSSDRFPDVWELIDVPSRSKILIHAGNTTDDTRGCILVGSRFGAVAGKPAVMNSRATMDMLRAALPDYFKLTIKDMAHV